MRPSLALGFSPLLLHACHRDQRGRGATADTGSCCDSQPATEPVCDTGLVDDEGECVPAACGTGNWGDSELDESTVYVDITASKGGDGSVAAPFASIQAGLDAAGDAGGGMVAVAAGTYPETLELGRSHADVHLAGRCRELVIIDASAGDETTPGILVDARSWSLEVSGVTVSGSNYTGVLVGSGAVALRDSKVVGSQYVGIVAYQDGFQQTSLVVESCEVSGNKAAGVIVVESGVSATLRETTIEGTQADGDGQFGYGIDVYAGANLRVESCVVSGNTSAGVHAADSGTSVHLSGTTVRDTLPDGDGMRGYGIEAFEGASLEVEACDVTGNTGAGVVAAESGTTVVLLETTIQDSLPDVEGAGCGVEVHYGASLKLESSEVSGNRYAGIFARDADTVVALSETTIQDTLPNEEGLGGYGIEVTGDADLVAESCDVSGNTAAGVLARGSGTSVILKDSNIVSTRRGEVYTVGVGVSVTESATVEAGGVAVSSSEGPGLYVVGADSHLACSACVLQGNQFAGAVVAVEASLELIDSLIEGTAAQENLGGGVGIYSEPWHRGPPALKVTGSTIQGNPIAGVWLSGEGAYSFAGNTIRGGEGWTRESLTKCGDAVYAQDGVAAWDGSSGLLLEDNELLDGLGAGLFLDGASATLSGNIYANNAADLVSQGADCSTPPVGYEAEAFSTVELCPAYDYATCGDEFVLFLELAEPES